jgi:hypothetical protein
MEDKEQYVTKDSRYRICNFDVLPRSSINVASMGAVAAHSVGGVPIGCSGGIHLRDTSPFKLASY